VTALSQGANAHYTRTVPLSLEVVAPLACVPSQLFFGSIQLGQTVTRRILLRSSVPAGLPDPNMIEVSHSLQANLSTCWDLTKASDNCLYLSATLTADGEPRVIRETLNIVFRDAETPSIKIPIIASVVRVDD
jgi:hypothetical protein